MKKNCFAIRMVWINKEVGMHGPESSHQPSHNSGLEKCQVKCPALGLSMFHPPASSTVAVSNPKFLGVSSSPHSGRPR